jgi:hypothetical protein
MFTQNQHMPIHRLYTRVQAPTWTLLRSHRRSGLQERLALRDFLNPCRHRRWAEASPPGATVTRNPSGSKRPVLRLYRKVVRRRSDVVFACRPRHGRWSLLGLRFLSSSQLSSETWNRRAQTLLQVVAQSRIRRPHDGLRPQRSSRRHLERGSGVIEEAHRSALNESNRTRPRSRERWSSTCSSRCGGQVVLARRHLPKRELCLHGDLCGSLQILLMLPSGRSQCGQLPPRTLTDSPSWRTCQPLVGEHRAGATCAPSVVHPPLGPTGTP